MLDLAHARAGFRHQSSTQDQPRRLDLQPGRHRPVPAGYPGHSGPRFRSEWPPNPVSREAQAASAGSTMESGQSSARSNVLRILFLFDWRGPTWPPSSLWRTGCASAWIWSKCSKLPVISSTEPPEFFLQLLSQLEQQPDDAQACASRARACRSHGSGQRREDESRQGGHSVDPGQDRLRAADAEWVDQQGRDRDRPAGEHAGSNGRIDGALERENRALCRREHFSGRSRSELLRFSGNIIMAAQLKPISLREIRGGSICATEPTAPAAIEDAVTGSRATRRFRRHQRFWHGIRSL